MVSNTTLCTTVVSSVGIPEVAEKSSGINKNTVSGLSGNKAETVQEAGGCAVCQWGAEGEDHCPFKNTATYG